jgi:hypothetical protein
LAQLIRFEGFVFFVFLESGLYLLPGIGGAERRIKALHTRAQSIDGSSFMAICGVFFLFVSSEGLLLNALEYDLENLGVNIRRPAVR